VSDGKGKLHAGGHDSDSRTERRIGQSFSTEWAQRYAPAPDAKIAHEAYQAGWIAGIAWAQAQAGDESVDGLYPRDAR